MIRFEVTGEQWLREISEAVESGVISAQDMAEQALDQAGVEVVAFLRGYTNQRNPPVREGQPARRAHPGGWSDVTSNLMNAFNYEVVRDQGSVSLVLFNTMEYAAILEARDGYFVLSGVTDPGGPVHKAIQEILDAIAPDWELDFE